MPDVRADAYVSVLSPEEPTYGETGLVLGEGVSFGRWVSVGATLRRMHSSLSWWVASWVAYGVAHYGDGAV